MMRIEIKTDNAAFEGDPAPEVARILEAVVEMMGFGFTEGRLHDINGNDVGAWSLS